MSEITNSPNEGELVVVSVTTVKQNGCYVTLDEFEGLEGFIFIGEIASGWVKNIRVYVREGQRLICKVMRTRKDGSSLELSLKSVSEERRRERLQEWKNEQRAHQLLKVLGEKVGWSQDEIGSSGEELSNAFGGLYSAFEEAAMNEGSLADAGFEGDWIKDFTELFLALFSVLLNICLIKIDRPMEDKIITLIDANSSNLINAELVKTSHK